MNSNQQDGPAVTGLRLLQDPRDPCWDLRRRPEGIDRTGLLGWITSEPATDAGVPKEVARVVARALCKSLNLTFIDSSSHMPANKKAWGTAADRRTRVLSRSVFDWLLGRPPFPVTCTSNPTVAERLFYDDKFPWTLRSQTVLLSALDEPPPDISYRAFLELWNGRVDNHVALADSIDLNGFAFPGVDGDYIEFVITDKRLWRTLISGLEKECGLSQLNWSVVSEAEFREGR